MNDPVSKMIQAKPLVLFSSYTQSQSDITIEFGNEILLTLEKCFVEEGIDATALMKVYGRFWMWVLASYEIARTMDQKPNGFESQIAAKIKAFKNHIALIRMPFAKQEYQGKNRQIKNEASIVGIDTNERDIVFQIESAQFKVRPLIARFEELISSIKPDDILSSIREKSK